ncbi:NAD-dependent glycerol-3-phosphate dehydrogenase domain protein [Gleimia coleocanis DSM 15436]|uniref:NAD-dependent glycerol-3-phosphate dehydrogenase domain protein n=1 Tax=Gleimia coleocanis DSM 15436 TaxID=525245 RepID=C0VYJ8_9ACTO|nr:DUF2520 domain-containing protein [Gleimia coleocanis]EEH64501.1 NAD-dependent glycerol-3-phosphate dehydrogenase domain protein [Gleimia coleocanis DSM 15436]
MNPKPGRLKVGVIGPGKVGVILALALRNVQHEVIGVTASTRVENQDRIEALLPGVPVLEAPELCAQADLVLVTVPDDEIRPVVAGLAKLNAWRPGQIVVHCSGAHGLAVLVDAAACGALTLALHPAMTFTGYSLDLQRLENCPAAVTANAIAQPIGQALLIEIGCQPQIVADENRKLYHAALAHGANHLNTLVAQSLELLREAGVADPALYLRPLLEAALDRALSEGINGLTGPVVRADTGTLTAHLEVLGTPSGEKIKTTYQELARATAELAHDHGRLTDTQYRAVHTALGAESL